MTNPRKRIPKIGDRVVALGHNGTFSVSGVQTDKLTVDLKLIGPADRYERVIPWDVLLFLNSEVNMEADRGAQSICTERDRVSGINSHKGAMGFLVVSRHSKTEAVK